MIVDERRDGSLFRRLTHRNLLWQYDFLIDSIHIGLDRRFKLTDYIVRSLNFFAVANIADGPGIVRNDDVHIEGAEHQPPGHQDVARAYLEFIPHLHEIWDQWDGLHVAAYVLWKVNWIHPFLEGNGRTARAAMYYTLSIKMGRILKGRSPIPDQIRRSPQRYYELLRSTDRTFRAGKLDLGPLAEYLGELLEKQLASSVQRK
jgi:Fic family protein